MSLAADWEAFLNTLSPKFYVALTGTSSLISGLILIFEWMYFQRYGVCFIEQLSLNHIRPFFGGDSCGHKQRPATLPEYKYWRNPMHLLRGAEYQRYLNVKGKEPLTFQDMNLSSQDHQNFFVIDSLDEEIEEMKLLKLAWRERKPSKRVKMARQVLELNAECAAAYIILAEEETTTVLEAEKVFREGLAIAESNHKKSQALQHQSPTHEAIHRRDTNVLYYIKRRLAMCARKLSRNKEAAKMFRDLLKELPPSVNFLNVQENLIEVLLEMQAYGDVQAVLSKYDDITLPKSATICYTSALLRARVVADKFCPNLANKRGLTPAELVAVEAVHRAVEFNPHVPQYLLEMKPLILPTEHMIKRGDTEAVAYAFAHLQHWKNVEGALNFLHSTWESTFRLLPYPLERGLLFHPYPVDTASIESDLIPDHHPQSIYPKREIPFLIFFTAILCVFTAALAVLINYYPMQMGGLMKSVFLCVISPFFFVFEKIEALFPSNFMQTLSRV